MEKYIPAVGDSFMATNIPYGFKDTFIRMSDEYAEIYNSASKIEMIPPVGDNMIFAAVLASGRELTKAGVGSFIYIQIEGTEFKKVALTFEQDGL